MLLLACLQVFHLIYKSYSLAEPKEHRFTFILTNFYLRWLPVALQVVDIMVHIHYSRWSFGNSRLEFLLPYFLTSYEWETVDQKFLMIVAMATMTLEYGRQLLFICFYFSHEFCVPQLFFIKFFFKKFLT